MLTEFTEWGGGGMSATKNEKCCFPYLVAYAGPARLLPSLP